MNLSPFSKASIANVVIAVPLVILNATLEIVGLAKLATFILHEIAFEEQRRGGQTQ